MSTFNLKQVRVLAIAPSSKGFGFAVLEGAGTFVDWGVKSVDGDKNAASLVKVKRLIIDYAPSAIVLEDMRGKDCRRSARVQTLAEKIIQLAASHQLKTRLISQQAVRFALSLAPEATKHEIATRLANHFPEELGSRLPPKRKAWMSEDYRMNIFDAVALATAYFRATQRRVSTS
jgi:hypothetical protein